MSWKRHFSRFLPDGRLHFAAHSHHPWPDASFEAHQQAWLDAARLADTKWERVFGELVPRAQAHVARILRLPDPGTVCFAPSTHELVMRLWSTLRRAAPRVLTTDGEFHSFARQLRRLEEDGAAEVTRVPVEPFASFAERFAASARRGPFDLVYFSQVFFGSGFRPEDPAGLVRALPEAGELVVVDGYHGYMAVPTDWSAVAPRAFYLAGGYKYAMAGEGACFMHCPPGLAPRPPNTGWFAAFGNLSRAQDGVPYPEDGTRFMGGTYDPTPLYRLVAVQEWLQREGITVAAIRAHAERLQDRFLRLRSERGLLPGAVLVPPAGTPRGNFLVFRDARAADWHRALLAAAVYTDRRDDRLRIGFGLYQDEGDVDRLAEVLERACR